jgi:DNA-binding beta-propeller fold protein YncE
VYVADTWNGRVQVFSPGGNAGAGAAPTATWRVPGWQPQTYDDPSIAVFNGQVLVSTPGRNSVLLTDTSGAEIMRWGGAGNDLASMSLPSGVAFAPDGTVYVVDRGNTRIMHFKLPLPGR